MWVAWGVWGVWRVCTVSPITFTKGGIQACFPSLFVFFSIPAPSFGLFIQKVSPHLFVSPVFCCEFFGYPSQTDPGPPKTPHSHLQAVRHGQKWDPGQLSELGDLYAGQGSLCPFVCAPLSQLFQDLKKQRKLKGEVESSRTKFGSSFQALDS